MNPNDITVKVEFESKATLGEGSLWHPVKKQLYWVDIESRLFHIYNPGTVEHKSFDVKERIGTVVPAEDGEAIVALQNGLHRIDINSGEVTFITNPIQDPLIRFNDGKCDAAGRLWVGTMHEHVKKGVAKLYKVNHDFSVEVMLEKLAISNGIAWTSDNKKMYFTDTPTQEVWAFDFDMETGNISNRSVAIKIPKAMGSPDGMTIDSQDNLWIALHGGGAVCCFDPSTGTMLQKIDVPAPNTTSCAFGGEDLKTLYITTARKGLTEDQLTQYPFSGSVFSCRTTVAGVEANFFKNNSK